MWIGAAKIVMDFYNNSDVRLKRKNLEELIHDVRKRFNVSVFEVESFDDTERCVLGVSVVMPQNWAEPRAREFLQKICHDIDTTSFARVTSESLELFSLD